MGLWRQTAWHVRGSPYSDHGEQLPFYKLRTMTAPTIYPGNKVFSHKRREALKECPNKDEAWKYEVKEASAKRACSEGSRGANSADTESDCSSGQGERLGKHFSLFGLLWCNTAHKVACSQWSTHFLLFCRLVRITGGLLLCLVRACFWLRHNLVQVERAGTRDAQKSWGTICNFWPAGGVLSARPENVILPGLLWS